MQDGIVIKSSKAGMTVILNPDLPFPDLLASIAKKFGDSARFWGNAQMTLTLEGRPLSAEEEFQIVNTITEKSQLQILCLLDTDAERIERCEKALNEKLMELSAQTGQFYRGDLHRGTLKRGDTLESEASIVIIGDVEHGARVTAKGNVIILGELKGTVTAGAAGNDQAVILAFSMSPLQLRIGNHTSRFNEKNHKLGKGTMIASVENGELKVLPLKKPFFSSLLDL